MPLNLVTRDVERTDWEGFAPRERVPVIDQLIDLARERGPIVITYDLVRDAAVVKPLAAHVRIGLRTAEVIVDGYTVGVSGESKEIVIATPNKAARVPLALALEVLCEAAERFQREEEEARHGPSWAGTPMPADDNEVPF